jgi:hypothetical protein
MRGPGKNKRSRQHSLAGLVAMTTLATLPYMAIGTLAQDPTGTGGAIGLRGMDLLFLLLVFIWLVQIPMALAMARDARMRSMAANTWLLFGLVPVAGPFAGLAYVHARRRAVDSRRSRPRTVRAGDTAGR